MISYRLPVLGAIAVIVALIFNCGVAVSEPTTSADYVMPGCRELASLVTFSNVGESEEEVSRMSLCAGIVIGLSFMGQSYGICVPTGTTAQQATGIVVQYIDGQPARIHEDFNRFAVEALRANWPCSLAAGDARDPLAGPLIFREARRIAVNIAKLAELVRKPWRQGAERCGTRAYFFRSKK
jgi:hypothetical protein